MDYLGLVFSVLIALGGAVGYFKSGSVASLVSGFVFGALIELGAQAAERHSATANLLPAAPCLVLGLVMGWRFVASGKVMPAGVVAALSLLMAGRYVVRALA